MLDVWTGRRTEFLKCRYWIVNDAEYIPNDRIEYEEVPTGTFYAREENAYTLQNQLVGDSFMVDQDSVVISTKDKIPKLKNNDKVEFLGNVYRVSDFQCIPVKKQRQFLTQTSYTSYISLRR